MKTPRASSFILISALFAPFQAAAAEPPKGLTGLRCGRLIDGKRATQVDGVVVIVEGERIKEVGTGLVVPAGARVVDLGRATCLPGLIDNHTHVLLTLRDLETEGAMYADVDVKTAINRGVIPGPRMFVATRAMAPTGTYPLLGYSWELRVPEGVQIVDGADNVRRAVREQWCPTIYVGAYVAEGRATAGAPIWKTMVDLERQAFGKAVRKGVKISYGTDAGGYAWTESQAKEFSYMVRYGMTPMQAIQSATSVAAALLGQEANLGTVEPGRYADVVAVKGDPLVDIAELERVSFVMKGGTVYKQE